MIRQLVRLRDRNQITLPAEITERLSVEPGSLLELIFDPAHGLVELRHAEVVRAGTPQAEREERWAREDIKAGRFTSYASPEELALDLGKSAAAVQLQDQMQALQKQLQDMADDLRKMSQASEVSLTGAASGETSVKAG